MEGMGSRQSRAASRYGASPAPAFNGPVRKWKKQWVSSSHSKNGNSRKESPPLLLCRWTPLSAAAAEEPPRRRFRYAPIVPIEKGNMKGAEKVKNEAVSSARNEANNGGDVTSESEVMLEKPDTGDISMEEEALELSEDPNRSLVQGSYYEQKKGE